MLAGVGERQRSRARERIAALADGNLGAEEARRETIELLRGAVGFERWCWPLTDPASGLSVGGIGEVDFWPSLPRLLALEEHGDVTSKPQLMTGRRASVALSAATGGDLSRSRRWQECMRPYGIGDELMTACRDHHGCWASVELMRDAGDAPFAEEDARLLDQLAPTLGALVRRSLPGSWRTDGPGAAPGPPGTLILDAELHPTSWTPQFQAWQEELPAVGAGRRTESLPTAVYEIGARVLAPATSAAGRLPGHARIRTATGRWAVIEGAPLDGAERGGVAITVRAAGATEVLDVLCSAHGLTRRERQLVGLVLDGLATKQLAEALCISPYTVQDHLKAIFAKTAVRSRRELIAYLAGRLP
jgi:DNA-binding CsgD family transcriptional regulator